MSRNFMFSWYFLISNPIPLFSGSVCVCERVYVCVCACVLEEIHGHMHHCDTVKRRSQMLPFY